MPDGPAIAFDLAQAALRLYDGFTTKYFWHHGGSRIEVGPSPIGDWVLSPFGEEGTAGTIEVIATTYVHQSMRRPP
jgi:hypothetical protein